MVWDAGFTTRPELRGSFGMVASTHWLATAAAMGVLERGGNAFDAAVAGGFVLQIVEPHLNGPGGEVPILLAPAGSTEVTVICGQGPVPAAATLAHFQGLGLDIIPGTGLLPATVPGAFGAWCRLLAEHGTMELADVLAPALHYAETGFPVMPQVAQALANVAPMFEAEWPSSAEIHCSGGLPQAGDVIRNPGVAAVYQRVLAEAASAGGREARIEAARKAWYTGFVADAIHDFYTTARLRDTSGEVHGGLLTGDDMARYEARVERPVTYDHGDVRVAKCGPWSQGPVLLQTLSLLSGLPLDEMPVDGPDFIHAVVEASKLAYADREAWYGDPDVTDVPMETLLSDGYAAARRTLIADTASTELRAGSPDGRAPTLPRQRIAAPGSPGVAEMLGQAKKPSGEEPTTRKGAMLGDTCHIDVVDRWGNMVAATPSGGWFQSSPAVPGLGFSISTRGQMFWLEPGLATTLTPGARPRTTLTPSMALRDGKPWLAWGTPGGDQQDQWSLQFLLRVLHGGMNLQQAIDCPAFHSEHWQSSFWPREARPNRLVLEGRMPAATVAELKRRGHDVQVGPDWSEGRLQAVSQEDRGGLRWLRAASNPRFMQNYAAGR
ncbi:gamma-glutamyltransferase family protein [Futiania mangrovi]|uniref:Gamma-glutamyltransferase family protein n=1 Tax=Futiania mangrovi TaxID=2959716 RepID=A0A9J6PF87_9PROT|nr:gamma-glutamyltransferase family protein [Futiania mangrovii]MCP1335287.1 gamma-glutamyltransferase family protein [Futiania mangrovii]